MGVPLLFHVEREMTLATQPLDFQGLGIVGMVHFALLRAASFTRLLDQFALALGVAGKRAHSVFIALLSSEGMPRAPAAHVQAMTAKTISA
jgi:hypothetical protein